MAATMMTTTLSGSGTVAAAQLSAFGASFQALQQQTIVRISATSSKLVAVRASSNSEGRKPQQMLVALVAAGASLALTAAPVSPAHAGLFSNDDKVERGATTAPGTFPGNEGTGTKVGDNSSVRGAASSGTPLGEANKTVADAVETGIDVNIDPLKTKISDIDPFKDTLNLLKSEQSTSTKSKSDS